MGMKLKILPDHDPLDPRRDFDNLGTMVCYHKRYKIGDEQRDWREVDREGRVILPVYMYDHSGVTIRTKPFRSRWDSGQLGVIYIDHEIIEEVKGDLSDESREWARDVLRGEVHQVDLYLRGQVWGFVVKETCEHCGHELDEVVDSCWGHYGEDLEETGIRFNIPEEVEDQLEDAWEGRFDNIAHAC